MKKDGYLMLCSPIDPKDIRKYRVTTENEIGQLYDEYAMKAFQERVKKWDGKIEKRTCLL